MRDLFYASRPWRKLRADHIRKHPLCEECLRMGRHTLVAIVDHILPRKTHPGLALVAVNLMSLCRPCHKRKTDKDYGKPTSAPKTGCDVDGVPLGKAGDDWHESRQESTQTALERRRREGSVDDESPSPAQAFGMDLWSGIK